ncbi:MAG: hypothetical protein ACHQF2_06190 [Flavobacteriales bacterium]
MKNSILFFGLILSMTVLSGCTTSFMGTVLVISFMDIILYVLIAVVIAFLVALMRKEKRKKAFWIWFILSLLLTPLAGFIRLLILIGKKRE